MYLFPIKVFKYGVDIHVLSERGVDVKIGGDDEGLAIMSDEGKPTCAKI